MCIRDRSTLDENEDTDDFIISCDDDDEGCSAIDALGDALLNHLESTTQVFRPSSASSMSLRTRNLSAPPARTQQRIAPPARTQSAQGMHRVSPSPGVRSSLQPIPRKQMDARALLPRTEYSPAARKRNPRRVRSKARKLKPKAEPAPCGTFQLLCLPRKFMCAVLAAVQRIGPVAQASTALWGLCLQEHLLRCNQHLVLARQEYELALHHELQGCHQQVCQQATRHAALQAHLRQLQQGNIPAVLQRPAPSTSAHSLTQLTEIVSRIHPEPLLALSQVASPAPLTLRLTLKLLCCLLQVKPHEPPPAPPLKKQPRRPSSAGPKLTCSKHTSNAGGVGRREAEWSAGVALMREPQGLIWRLREFNLGLMSPAVLAQAQAVLLKIDSSAKHKAYSQRVHGCYGAASEVAAVLCEWARAACALRSTLRPSLLRLMQAKASSEGSTEALCAGHRVWVLTCGRVSHGWVERLDLSELYNMVL
eukprot:TRINITY_DN12385_c0_g1_i3.p1 TRINITY_DN12385_c0_g1~~TRINITY_DN12385_c0_g1_i3.p1  ORF type:complete len:478 (+),score=114.65 TRINITY_DN12385_c0_g1_i3:91-1524(+)